MQQLHDSLLHELRGEMQASHQQLVAEIQQLFTQHAVVSTATPVAAVAPAAAPVQVLPASPRVPAAKMNPPTTYSGARGQDVSDFCFKIKGYVQYNHIPLATTEAVQCAASYLTGTAAKWWRVYCETHDPHDLPASLHAFCELLTNHFRATNLATKSLDELIHLEMTSTKEGLRDYTDRFLSLISSVPDMTPREHLFHYIKGLLPRLRAEL
ncbi:MAG: hypothetical protein ACK5XN_05470, partial [Bacteroidota bacterium]